MIIEEQRGTDTGNDAPKGNNAVVKEDPLCVLQKMQGGHSLPGHHREYYS